MRLEKAQECGEQRGLGRAGAKLVRPDSGQIDEPPGPALAPERCRKRGKGQHEWVGRGIILFSRSNA